MRVLGSRRRVEGKPLKKTVSGIDKTSAGTGTVTDEEKEQEEAKDGRGATEWGVGTVRSEGWKRNTVVGRER